MRSPLLLFSILASGATCGGCSAMAYYDEAMRYMRQTESVLIEEGLCSDNKDCSRKEMAFWTAGGWKIGPFTGGGVTIAAYNVPNAAIANKIINRCRDLHSQIPDVPVTVTVYSAPYHHGISKVVAREKIS